MTPPHAIQVQLGPIVEVLVEIPMTRLWFVSVPNTEKMPVKMPENQIIGIAQLHCPGIGNNADTWMVESVSDQNGASAAA